MTPRNTIFALSTPLARSAIAIIRLSGPSSLTALQQLTGKKSFVPNQAQLCLFKDEAGVPIDQGLALYFKAPHSFTGEDCVELHLHGSMASISHMVAALSEMEGLRLAEAGEFTRRAYLNGKMDLLEAEGLADLINADTAAQKDQALRQMAGSGSQYYYELREGIIRALAHLEAYIDFPDEDIPGSVLQGIKGQIGEIISLIEKTLADNRNGERLREGFSVVILGAPNAGKSSLINRLSGKDAAIVSHTAGTTRDVIEVAMNLGGFPVTLIDTAGVRESGDAIEEEGVRRALQRGRGADLKLLLLDGTNMSEMDNKLLEMADEDGLIVVTKIDKMDKMNIKLSIKNKILYISSVTGQGIDGLLAAITAYISSSAGKTPAIITRARHRQLLGEAKGHLVNYRPELPLELACEELRQAALAIGKITGKIAVDELLDVIFKQFCIGK